MDREPLLVSGQEIRLVWRAHYVVALLLPASDPLIAQLKDKGFEVVFLGTSEADWIEKTDVLAKLLGSTK